MSEETTQIGIGELARRAGLSVRTVRFYSDAGVLPESGRSDAGYRLYDPEAVERARLLRTLRELGVDLPAVRRVLEGAEGIGEVAARHALAVDAQIRDLRLQRGVLRAIAQEPDDPKEIEKMHELANLTAAERRRLIDGFVAEAFDGLPEDAAVRARMEAAPPDLPENPSAEQIDAWIELARLIADPDFRARTREMAVRGAEAEEDTIGRSPTAAKAVGRIAGDAVGQGIAPDSAAGADVLGRLLAEVGEPGDRGALAERLTTFTDRRVGRYWALVGTINGWPPVPDVIPAWEWFAAALRANPVPAGAGEAA
ncbi:MAG TPA: MerR family transcriptional regulator [Solirubrobacterales bacterium]|jgi:DNA-binding transcriptional MerR regulator